MMTMISMIVNGRGRPMYLPGMMTVIPMSDRDYPSIATEYDDYPAIIDV
jgi:hypothetical protein